MSNINFNIHEISNKTKKSLSKNLEVFSQTVLDDSNYYIPRRTDTLLQSGHVEIISDTKAEVIWDTPYANNMYQGIVWRDPNTGSTWAKRGQSKVRTDSAGFQTQYYNYSKDINPNAQAHWFEVAKLAKKNWSVITKKLFG